MPSSPNGASESLMKFRATRGEKMFIERYGESKYRSRYRHDLDKVTYAPVFRRTGHKQYFQKGPSPDARTRLLHSLEVSTIAVGMAERLGLNTDLTQAIAFAHDVGQPPFGLSSEIADFERTELRPTSVPALAHDHSQPMGPPFFTHEEFGYQLLFYSTLREHPLDNTAKRYRGIHNVSLYDHAIVGTTTYVCLLSNELLAGVRHHTRRQGEPVKASTLEAQLVQIADNLSYMTQDLFAAIKISEDMEERFKSYATREEFKLGGRSELASDLTDDVGRALAADPELLTKIFNIQIGARLSTMINRIEEYNKYRVVHDKCDWLDTDVFDDCRQIPCIDYDPKLSFIIAFIWDFIEGSLYKLPDVRSYREDKRKDMHELLDAIRKDGGAARFPDEYSFVKSIVDYFYGHYADHERAVRCASYYVAYLSDDQFDSNLALIRGHGV